jgi:hypothetical protein
MNSYGYVYGSPGVAPPPVGRKKPWWSRTWVYCVVVLVLVIGALIARTAIAMTSATRKSNAVVETFHQRLNAEQYSAIYSESDPLFQESDNEERLLKFFKMVHERLGNETEAKQIGIFMNATTKGTFARVTYQSKFDTGPATEVFTWRTGGPELKLVGYNVNSKALLNLE